MSFQGHGHNECGSAHCHGHGHESRRPKSFWPMQGACAGSLSLSPYSSPYSSLSHSLQSVLGFNVLCSPCPCRYFALPGLCFLHVFVFCGCAKRKSSMAAGVEGREGGQCCWLMTCGLNFPYSPLILLILLSPMVFLPDNLCALIAYFMAFNMCSSCCWLWGAVEIPSPPL